MRAIRTSALLIVGLVALGACSEDPAEPPGALFNRTPPGHQDCQFPENPDACQAIDAAIKALEAFENSETCRMIGGQARRRFDADPEYGGFRPVPPHVNNDSLVAVVGTRNGYSVDQITYIDWRKVLSLDLYKPKDLALLIAHEEGHQTGISHDDKSRWNAFIEKPCVIHKIRA